MKILPSENYQNLENKVHTIIIYIKKIVYLKNYTHTLKFSIVQYLVLNSSNNQFVINILEHNSLNISLYQSLIHSCLIQLCNLVFTILIVEKDHSTIVFLNKAKWNILETTSDSTRTRRAKRATNKVTKSSYGCINNTLQIKKHKPEDYIIIPIQYKGWFHHSW